MQEVCAPDGNRTRTRFFVERDFKSRVSTSSTTGAHQKGKYKTNPEIEKGLFFNTRHPRLLLNGSSFSRPFPVEADLAPPLH